MIKSIVSVAALMLLAVPSIYSKTISRADAEAIAKNWKNNSEVTTRGAINNDSPVMALELTDETTEQPSLWVFNYSQNAGYVIVAADDMVANPVLGYSDEGVFDKDCMPDNLKWWLNEYSRQIEYIRKNNLSQENITRAFDKEVKPLVATKWNQGNPYNLLCPALNGQLSVTGCVATATAQLMYFHQWPAVCEGSVQYVWSTGGQLLALNLKGLEFEWGNMTLTYSNNSTEDQKMAVATLMKAVGYASEMNYSPSASGASSYKAGQALIKYFGYSKDIRPVERDYISLSEFEGIMVDELNAGYPFYYAGRTKDAGHAFVCDGYNKEGYFHINWGWGGMSDGYFLTTALGPDAQGIGGADDAFNYSQSIYTNIRPKTTNNADADYSPLLLSAGALASSAKSVSVGGTTRFTLSGYVYNYGLGDCSFSVGMGVYNEKNELLSVATGASHNIRPYYGNAIAAITYKVPNNIEEGTYFIRPVFKVTGTDEWLNINMKVSNPQSILMRVKDNVVTFATPTTASLTATNFVMKDNSAKKSYVIDVDIENIGMTEYYGDMKLVIRETEESATNLAESDIAVADIESGKTSIVTFVGKAPSRGGELVAVVLDAQGKKIGAQVLDFEKGDVNISAARASVIDNPDMKTVKYTCYLTNTGGDFTGKLYLRFYINENGTTLLDTYEKEVTLLDSDGTKEITFEFEPKDPKAGKSYTCILLIDIDGTLSEVTKNRTRKTFTMSSNAAVGNIIDNNNDYAARGINGGVEVKVSEATQVRVYNAAGALVAYSQVEEGVSVINVPAGFYIVRTGNGCTCKVIVK